MNFLKKHYSSLKSYATACPIATLFFLFCAVVTDEFGAWLVFQILTIVTIVVCLLTQIAHDLHECEKAETENEPQK